MKKTEVEKIIIEVPDELVYMAVDIASLQGFPTTRPIRRTLKRALRVGLAHLLVLEEENAKWKMKNGS